jgi:hypothetical protein
MVRCLVYNPSAQKTTAPAVVDIDDFRAFLEEHNPGCTFIGCATRYFNGVPHDIWHDDEFLFHGGLPSGYATDYDEVFLGCTFICNVDEETGESTDLTDEDIQNILFNCTNFVKVEVKGKNTPLCVFECTVFEPEDEEESE